MSRQLLGNAPGLQRIQRLLPSLAPVGPNDSNVDIVITSEPGKQMSKSLLDALYAMAPRAQIYEFKVSLSHDESLIWPSLVNSGKGLLDSLLEKGRTEYMLCRRPLLFIGHGLGGIVIKRALSILHEDYYKPGYQELIDSERGIIFLGTPHLTFGRQTSWPRMSIILRHCTKIAKAAALQAESEIATIANVSRKFEEADIAVPIISAYETKEVKISGSIFKSHRELLVDRQFAETALKNERLIEATADHDDITHINIGSTLWAEILQMISSAIESAVEANTGPRELAAIRVPHSAFMTGSSITDASEVKLPLTPTTNLSPPQVTDGSTDISGFEMVSGVSTFTSQQTTVELPCYLLGPNTRNPMFHGRGDILAMVSDALVPTGSNEDRHQNAALRSFALCGLGGVGKTQIAVEYAFSSKPTYEAIFWMQASSIAKLDESFTQISVELGLEKASKAGDRVVSRNLVMSWLSNPVSTLDGEEGLSRNKPVNWLMIFDNADDPEILSDYWPGGKHGAVLVTSRDPLAKTSLYCKQGIDLDPLSIEESASLLRSLAIPEQSDAQAEQSIAVAKRLGGLPLAISQAAAYIQSQDLTYSEFLEICEVESMASKFRQVKLGYNQEYPHTLSTVWALDSLDQKSKTLLNVLAFLDPDCIDEVMLKQELEMPSIQYPGASIASYISSRKALLRCSLIRKNKASGQLVLHRLTQEAVRSNLSKDDSSTMFAAATNLAYGFWPISKIPFSHNTDVWATSQKVVPHALWLQNLFLENGGLARSVDVRKTLADLLQKVGWYFNERGTYRKALPILEVAESLCRNNIDDMQVEYGHILFALTSTTCYLCQQERAIGYATKNLNLRLKMGRIDTYLGMAHLQMGLALIVCDRFEEAIDAFHRSLEVTAQFSEVPRQFPNIFLAKSLCETGRPSEAAMIMLEIIRFRENRFGPNDTESKKLGLCLQTLGNARFKQGFLAEAVDAYQKALINYRATIGDQHHSVGQTYVKLAQLYIDMGQEESAMIHIDQALNVFEDRPNLQPYLAHALWVKWKVVCCIADDATGEPLLTRAKSLYEVVVREGRGRQAKAGEFEFGKMEPII